MFIFKIQMLTPQVVTLCILRKITLTFHLTV